MKHKIETLTATGPPKRLMVMGYDLPYFYVKFQISRLMTKNMHQKAWDLDLKGGTNMKVSSFFYISYMLHIWRVIPKKKGKKTSHMITTTTSRHKKEQTQPYIYKKEQNECLYLIDYNKHTLTLYCSRKETIKSNSWLPTSLRTG